MHALRIAVIVLISSLFAGCGYNTLQQQDEQVTSAWSEVLNQYQRRADLVPNLVNIVKGAVAAEKDILDSVIEARAKATSIQATPELINNPQAFQQWQAAQGELSSALSRLMVVVERYPDLKSISGFNDLTRAARRHREPHRRRAQALHRCRAGLQRHCALVPDESDGEDVRPRRQAELHRRERGARSPRPPTVDFGTPPRRAAQPSSRMSNARSWQRAMSAPLARCRSRRLQRLCRATALGSLACSLLLCAARASPGRRAAAALRRSPDPHRTRSRPIRSRRSTSRLRAFEAKKGSQIAVLIVPTTQPETIEQYSIRVAEAWKLGRKGVDDGVLLLVAKDDRAVRIEVGYGLEGALPDVLANRITDQVIVPRFRSGDFSAASRAPSIASSRSSKASRCPKRRGVPRAPERRRASARRCRCC